MEAFRSPPPPTPRQKPSSTFRSRWGVPALRHAIIAAARQGLRDGGAKGAPGRFRLPEEVPVEGRGAHL
eukprot:6196940-Pleurochrysis_carterae.AAC.1